MKNKFGVSARSLAFATLCAVLPSTPLAADSPIGPGREQDGGYLDIGMGLFAAQSARNYKKNEWQAGIEISLNAGYRYRNFFIYAVDTEFASLTAGYTAYESERWTIDLMAVNVSGVLTLGSDNKLTENETARDKKTLERDSFINGTGIRVSHYVGDTLLRAMIGTETSKGKGLLGSAHAAHQWQLGNWNVRGAIGARYHSAKVNNYLWGISNAEASARFPAYTADSALTWEADIAASYPLGKNWVFRTRLLHRRLPKSVSNSPLASRKDSTHLNMTIHYVF